MTFGVVPQVPPLLPPAELLVLDESEEERDEDEGRPRVVSAGTAGGTGGAGVGGA